MMLSEFDITYMTQKSIKGQVITDHLAHSPSQDYVSVQDQFPDEAIRYAESEKQQYLDWELYFDGAANSHGRGAGAFLISPKGVHLPISVKIRFRCSNNKAEYEACIIRLKEALGIRIEEVDVYGDSSLVISQVNES